jgi:hypothetical protein
MLDRLGSGVFADLTSEVAEPSEGAPFGQLDVQVRWWGGRWGGGCPCTAVDGRRRLRLGRLPLVA